MQLDNFKGHLRTILAHKKEVMKNCVRAGIPVRGLLHDLSKFTPEEFCEGVEYYQGGTRSPNEGARESTGFSRAWMHHKGRNKHHFEYWTDYNQKTRSLEPVQMPVGYVVEMFCDRVAASKIYMGENYTDASSLAYYKRGSHIRRIHPKTAELLERLLNMLAKEGEERTFAAIRKMVKECRQKGRLYE